MNNISPTDPRLEQVLNFPQVQGLFGRRSRRFGFGMEIPGGPLAYKSQHEPLPLSDLERALLVAAATGVTGWNFGIPFTINESDRLSNYSLRLTGRTAPSAATICTTELFFTDDSGIYLTRTGSALFMPVGDVGEQLLALLAMYVTNGYTLYDDYSGRLGGNLESFIRTGVINDTPQMRFALSHIEQVAYSTVAMELALICQNIVLMMQAIGLGGWMYTGIYPNSALGAFVDEGIQGLGFRFARREDWTFPNPIGLDGYYESVCPPYVADMYEAAHKLAERKFGSGGTYDPATGGPFLHNSEIKGTVKPYTQAQTDCIGEMAQHIYSTYGRFPARYPTILLRIYTQAHHLELEFYDKFFGPGAYLLPSLQAWYNTNNKKQVNSFQFTVWSGRCRGGTMALVHYLKKPEMRNPVVVAAFAGWNDAADAATTAVKFLIDRWKPTRFAEIEAEEFYVFTETRPTISASKGKLRAITWPSNHFYAFTAPQFDRDIILYLGVEPQLKWKTFTSTFLEVCKRFNVSEALFLGAFLANIPHSMEVPVSGFSSNAEKLERLLEIDVQSSRYEGPTGMVGVLQDTFRRASIPVSSLWAAAPHYLAATPNIKVTAALLTYLNTFLSFDLDLSDIQSDAQHFEEQITMLVARDPEASAYVRKLEEQAGEILDEDDDELEDDDEIRINPDIPVSTGPLPSADSLIRSVEELLRKERENNQQKSDLDEDNE